VHGDRRYVDTRTVHPGGNRRFHFLSTSCPIPFFLDPQVRKPLPSAFLAVFGDEREN
jgi:hypothetical protein